MSVRHSVGRVVYRYRSTVQSGYRYECRCGWLGVCMPRLLQSVVISRASLPRRLRSMPWHIHRKAGLRSTETHVHRKTGPGCRRDPFRTSRPTIHASEIGLDDDLLKERTIHVYFVMLIWRGQPRDSHYRGWHLCGFRWYWAVVVMGRHKKMPAAVPAAEDSLPGATAELMGHGGADSWDGQQYAPRAPRMSVEMLDEHQRARYDLLIATTTIKVAEGPLKTQALESAAILQARCPFVSEEADRRGFRRLARYLYDDALDHGEHGEETVDEWRALSKQEVNQWLFRRAQTSSRRSVKTYEQDLARAGRLIYPQQYPVPREHSASRQKGQRAVVPGTAEFLYSIAVSLSPKHARMLRWQLDLITGAGMRTGEIKDLRGSDVSVMRDGDDDLVVVRVPGRWGKVRWVPVVDPGKAARILARARQVGEGLFVPLTANGEVDRNALNRINRVLKKRGFASVDAVGLRNRWLVDLACRPGIPAAALMSVAGVGDLRILADQADSLPRYTPQQLARLFISADAIDLDANLDADTDAELDAEQGRWEA